MLPDTIFDNQQNIVPSISISEIAHEDLGERVIRVTCKANGLQAKRLTQDIYGVPVNRIPVWSIEGRIVADWFALILENAYQLEMSGKTVILAQ